MKEENCGKWKLHFASTYYFSFLRRIL